MGKYEHLSGEKIESKTIGELCKEKNFSSLLDILNKATTPNEIEAITSEMIKKEYKLVDSIFSLVGSFFDKIKKLDKKAVGDSSFCEINDNFHKITTALTLLEKLKVSLNDINTQLVKPIFDKLKEKKNISDCSIAQLNSNPECIKAISDFISYYNDLTKDGSTELQKMESDPRGSLCLLDIISLNKKSNVNTDALGALFKNQKHPSDAINGRYVLLVKQIFFLNLEVKNEMRLFSKFLVNPKFLLENLTNLPKDIYITENFRKQIIEVFKVRLTEVEYEKENSRLRHFKHKHISDKIEVFRSIIADLEQTESDSEIISLSLISEVLKKYPGLENILSKMGCIQAEEKVQVDECSQLLSNS